MSNPHFYSVKPDGVQNLITAAVTASRITSEDADLILKFIQELKATAGISERRAQNLTGQLIRLKEYLPVFNECTIDSVYAAINSIKSAKKDDGTPRYSANTLNGTVHLLKRFFLWLTESGLANIDTVKLQKIRIPKQNHQTLSPDEILTETEVQQLIETAGTVRDKALISIMYKGALRCGEIAALRWCDVTSINGNGIQIRTNFKTQITRFIPIYGDAVLYFEQYKASYTGDKSPTALVFTGRTGQPLQHNALLLKLQRLAKRAGIDKHIKLHLLRHSRITHLLQQGVSESTVKLMAWGSVSSPMLRTYAHLSGSDVERELRRLHEEQVS